MAGISTKDVKTRIRSMASTQQITKAMEMVAASKLRRAQAQLLRSKPYFEVLCDTIQQIAANNRDFSSPYLAHRPVKKVLFLVIAGDRGLAGGYNSNVLKIAANRITQGDVTVLPIGKKAVDFFQSREIPILTDSYAEAAAMTIRDCFHVARDLSRSYRREEFGEIHMVYTRFESVLSQTPTAMQLLPLVYGNQTQAKPYTDFLYEPNRTEALDAIVPEYLGGILYGALCESQAAEQAARRTAMDSATSNAEDLIASLRQSYNRARQAAITQEITEIVAGSQ